MVATLEVIFQGKNESLWDYIEWFNNEVVQVWGAIEKMKLYLLESGLQQRMDFRKAIVVEDPKFSMSSLTSQKYTSGTREKSVPKTLKKNKEKRILKKNPPREKIRISARKKGLKNINEDFFVISGDTRLSHYPCTRSLRNVCLSNLKKLGWNSWRQLDQWLALTKVTIVDSASVMDTPPMIASTSKVSSRSS